MSYLPLEKRILYSNVFCCWRDKTPKRLICRHIYSYWVCDLDLCPICCPYFVNIIFWTDGVYLIKKKPAPGESVAGKWERYKIDIDPDHPEEARKKIEELIADVKDKIPEKQLKWLWMKFEHIVQRWRFLYEHGFKVGYVEKLRAERAKAAPVTPAPETAVAAKAQPEAPKPEEMREAQRAGEEVSEEEKVAELLEELEKMEESEKKSE